MRCYPATGQPAHRREPVFTAILTFKKHGKGTRYTALVIHKDEDGCRKHAAMGFHDGWGKALDQLVALMKKK